MVTFSQKEFWEIQAIEDIGKSILSNSASGEHSHSFIKVPIPELDG